MKHLQINTDPTLSEAIEEVKRELAMREKVMPKWIQNRRITRKEALNRYYRLNKALRVLQDQQQNNTGKQTNLFPTQPPKGSSNMYNNGK